MSTAIWIAVSLVCAGWLLIVAREIRDLLQPAVVEPAPADPRAWLADRARTETDMSRRAAWRSLRRVMQEEDEL